MCNLDFLKSTIKYYEGVEKRVLNTERARVSSDVVNGLNSNISYFEYLLRIGDIKKDAESQALLKQLKAINLCNIAERRAKIFEAKKMQEKQQKKAMCRR